MGNFWNVITVLTSGLSIFFAVRELIKVLVFNKKVESWVHSLRGFHSSLGIIKNCEESELIRHNIASTLADMESYLRSGWLYRKHEIKLENHRKKLFDIQQEGNDQ